MGFFIIFLHKHSNFKKRIICQERKKTQPHLTGVSQNRATTRWARIRRRNPANGQKIPFWEMVGATKTNFME